MACRSVDVKPLSELMMEYIEIYIPYIKIAFQTVVCEMAAILFRPQCVKRIMMITENIIWRIVLEAFKYHILVRNLRAVTL